MTPDRERELVEIRLAFLTLARVVIDGREDLARAQRRHDGVCRAAGEAMEQHCALADADRQAGLAVGMSRTAAHGRCSVPLTAELANDAVCLFLDRGSLTLGHL
ncbi:hypothetical protein [Sphingomonas sp. NIC1]|uniref:hypothetical protein n=1 Tax=Sphingomonas sp. NIC1 TaxID=1961362 RepID=UPI0018657215|nr:hypothetical protein [Sphingomonas sp. NIC1]